VTSIARVELEVVKDVHGAVLDVVIEIEPVVTMALISTSPLALVEWSMLAIMPTEKQKPDTSRVALAIRLIVFMVEAVSPRLLLLTCMITVLPIDPILIV